MPLTHDDLELWKRYINSPEPGRISAMSVTRRQGLDNLPRVLDLHGLTLQAAWKTTREFIDAHYRADSREITIICGKGGQIAKEIADWCQNTGMVRECSPIMDKAGSYGSYKIKLVKRKS